MIEMPANAAPMTVKVVEYDSPAVARKLKFRICLPADYETSTKRYPVLYLLHGFSGDYTSWNKFEPEKAAEPYGMILVQPDYGNSWCVNWSESAAGQKNNWEDAIIKDLIPYIDSHFRTIAAREGRAINGISMGGYSALTLGLRNPELFCSISGHSGLLDWARGFGKKLKTDPNAVLPERKPEKKIKPAIGLADFDDQEERTPIGRIFKTVAECDAHDPYVLAATMPVEKMPHINFDCGTEDSYHGYNQDLLLILLARKVPFTYSQSPGAHASAYWRREVGMSMAIQHEVIQRNLAEKAKAMPTSKERLRDPRAEIPGERLRSRPHLPE
jgi:S-formylglutathione hydrolase FrmB